MNSYPTLAVAKPATATRILARIFNRSLTFLSFLASHRRLRPNRQRAAASRVGTLPGLLCVAVIGGGGYYTPKKTQDIMPR